MRTPGGTGQATLMLVTTVLCLALPAIAAEKVTLCHAAGRDVTTHFETITISASAAYGPAGHLNEDGSPQAGHEMDYLGECQAAPSSTSTTAPAVTTTTTDPAVTTTTADAAVTTTTADPAVTPTTEPGVTTTAATTQSAPGEPINPTASVASDDETSRAALLPIATAGLSDEVLSITDPVAAGDTSVSGPTTTELPFTGIDPGLTAAVALELALAGNSLLTWKRSYESGLNARHLQARKKMPIPAGVREWAH
ncbi:MAG TPA: hypothetical protein VLA54_07760 [Acidimicrobiia bacterium]|nr:hypothetical protein [Acidimicrobiia bacterium]